MSRGPGVVQRRLTAIIEGAPERQFEIKELAALVFPGETLGPSQLVSVRRALRGLDVHSCKVGYGPGGGLGWRLRVGVR